jgi:C1A family cysteine protease
MASTAQHMNPGLGWHRDPPDPHDYTPEHKAVVRMLQTLSVESSEAESVDWREYCTCVGDQNTLMASTAFACTSLLQYFERRALGNLIEPSRLFVYNITRRQLGWRGDSGAQLRATLKAIAQFGIPSEDCWRYEPANLDDEPDSFAYASARRFDSLCYVRLDDRGRSGEATLDRVKSFLSAGFACVFGFPVTNALTADAEIPMPTAFEHIRGGHAVMAVGYDNQRRFRSYRGALLIRNSWGADWGEQGYGWLPYAYVREQLAVDFWTVLSPRWLASGEFYQP